MSGMSSYSGRQITNGGVTAPTINFTSTLVKYEGDTANVNKTANAQTEEMDFSAEFGVVQTNNLTGSLDIEVSEVDNTSGLARFGATVGVFGISLVEGLLDFGETLIDTGALLVSAVATPFTALYDLAAGTNVTGSMWEGTKAFVSKEYVHGWFDGVYEATGLDKTAGKYFNGARSIGSGIGYTAGMVLLTIATFGAGGAAGAGAGAGAATTSMVAAGSQMATGMAVVSGVAGIGKGTEDAWNDGAGIAEGLTYGVATGAWNAAQAYVGGQISGFNPTGSYFNNAMLRVGLHAADSGADAFLQPAFSLLYKDETYKEAFDERGGWTTVGSQMAVGGLMSMGGEAIDATKIMIRAGKAGLDTNPIHMWKEAQSGKYHMETAHKAFVTEVGVRRIGAMRFDASEAKLLSDKYCVNVVDLGNGKFAIDPNDVAKMGSSYGVLFNRGETSEYALNASEHYLLAEKSAEGLYAGHFVGYREHTAEHSFLVADYAINKAKEMGLDADDLNVVKYSALGHDFGMGGGDIISGSTKDGFTAQSILAKYGLSGDIDLTQQIDDNDLSNSIGNAVRKNHPYNSAREIMGNGELLPDSVSSDEVALIALSHSKSTSGVQSYMSKDQWLEAYGKLKTANPDFDSSGSIMRAITEGGADFERLQDMSWALRAGDAFSDPAVDALTQGQKMQNGRVSEIKVATREANDAIEGYTPGQELKLGDITDGNSDAEAKAMQEVLRGSDGLSDLTMSSDANAMSMKIHAGEGNVKFSDTINPSRQTTVTARLTDANLAPNSTFRAVAERLDELATADHLTSREFQIVLPKSAEGTTTADFYQAAIDSYVAAKRSDYESLGLMQVINGEKVYPNEDFLQNIKIVYE